MKYVIYYCVIMLSYLISRPNIAGIKERLAKYPKELHAPIPHYGSILSEAVANRSVEIVKLLLEYGANVNFKDCNNITPLMRAIVDHNKDKEKIVKLLLEYDANVNAQANHGYTSLGLDMGYNGNLTEILLEYGADPNLKTQNGRSVIDLLNSSFIYNNRKNVIENLLANYDGNNKSKILNLKN